MTYADLLKKNIQNSCSKLFQDEDYYYFYKYMSFDENRTIELLKEHHLVYRVPCDFNDPYDCLCKIEYDFSELTLEDAITAFEIDFTPEWFQKNKNTLIGALENSDIIKKWGDSSRNQFSVTCFNNSPLNILMWSHYALNHTGLMLEFKFAKKFLAGYDNQQDYSKLPMPVFYIDEYPILNLKYNLSLNDLLKDEVLASEFLIKRLLTKADVWSYENEFRLVAKAINQNGINLVKFDPSSLSSIILGSKFNEEHRTLLESAVDNYNEKHGLAVEIYQTNLSETEYKLEVKAHPQLDKKSP